MKRTNQRIIRLPSFTTLDEQNVRSCSYIKSTAEPTLTDNILAPFSNTLKEKGFQEAVQEIGIDKDGLLLGQLISEQFVHRDMHFKVRSKKVEQSSYEEVITLFEDYLLTIIEENKKGIRKDGVRKIKEEAYVTIEDMLRALERFKEENKNAFNQNELLFQDDNGKKYALDEDIQEMRVYLDLERYARTNNNNADNFLRAKSLAARLSTFRKAFEAGVKKEHGIPDEGLEEKIAYDYELSDGSAVRYLFYPQKTISYGNIYKELAVMKEKKAGAKTGDLKIIELLAFKEDYKNLRKNSAGLTITTTRDEEHPAQGKITITRTNKTHEPQNTRTYNVFMHKNTIYVCCKDVLTTMEALKKPNNTTNFKYNFFAAIPDNL
jgi:hypothetical protein